MSGSETVKKIHDLFSNNRFDEVLNHVTDDVCVNAYAWGMTFSGKEEFRNFMTGFKEAFPDMKLAHNNIFENGGQVCVEFSASGKHTGVLRTPAGDIPATGNEVKLTIAEVFELRGGKICNIRNYQDSASLMRQLGIGI